MRKLVCSFSNVNYIPFFPQQASSVVKDKVFISNKVAQLFALAFRADYTRQWPSFFVDLLQSLSLGERVVDMYLHILMAIDSDVVDRDIVHTVQVGVNAVFKATWSVRGFLLQNHVIRYKLYLL